MSSSYLGTTGLLPVKMPLDVEVLDIDDDRSAAGPDASRVRGGETPPIRPAGRRRYESMPHLSSTGHVIASPACNSAPGGSFVQIAVIGTGYVGLVTGAGLADFGNDVICCDIDQRKIDALNRGEIPIYEPGLDTIVKRNVAEGRMKFTTDLPEAIRSSRAIFIAVGTPPKPDGSADLRYVEEVARSIARYMNGPKLVVTKSTVPIGTGRMIERILAEAGGGHRASIVSNPGFLPEGSAIEDFMRPDRVVIGASAQEAAELMKQR